MAYIGNTVQNQGFAPAIDYFSGNGSTVTFTLSRPLASVAQIICAIDNVIQNPSSAFTVSGNSITFTSAPLSGTNNIWVEYTSLITTYAAISQDPSVIGDITASGGYLATGDFGNSYIDGTIVDYVTGNARITTGPIDDMTFYHGGSFSRSEMMTLYYAGGAKIYGTTALTIPSGTTAQRPGTPAVGMQRFNTTTGSCEYWNGVTWTSYGTSGVSTSTINYLMIAGGGGGGHGSTTPQFSGGGAGGVIQGSSVAITSGSSYTITVGSGGAGGSTGTSGGNTTAFGATAIGGGYGGGGGMGAGGSGGSGGGQGGSGGGGSPNNAAGTAGQGNQGGSGTTPQDAAGGGGGFSAAGQNASGTTSGNGGAGLTSSITGASVNYAGGGGRTDQGYRGGYLGSPSAAANSGSGGAGTAGNGGSGIVVISYSESYKPALATGTYSSYTNSGNYIYIFTGSGTITF